MRLVFCTYNSCLPSQSTIILSNPQMCPPKGVILTTILHMSEISSCSSTTVVVTYTQTPPTRRHVTGTDLTGDGLLKGFNKHAKKKRSMFVRHRS